MQRRMALWLTLCLSLAVTIALPQTHAQILSETETFSTIDFPGATETDANDISNNGTIVGFYVDTLGVDHGFSLVGGSFTTIDAPNSSGTLAYGINDNGDIVGWYVDQNSGVTHGFELQGTTFTTIDPQGSIFTNCWSINK